MRDTLKQRLFDLGYGTGSKTPSEAIAYIEELELELYEVNELYGAVKDGLEEKLATAMESLREIINRWDTPSWKDAEATGSVINRARTVLSALLNETAEGRAELERKEGA